MITLRASTFDHYGDGMSPCAVQRCMQEATWPVKLKEAGEASATYIWTEVCKPHRDLLASKSIEWILEITKDPLNPRWHQQTLMDGEDLQVLDEFILQEPPSVKKRPDVYSRIFSNNTDDRLHLASNVRRRGDEATETMTVVIPPSMVDELIQLLRDSQKPPTEQTNDE
jgi:hypothetical protein